MIGSTFVNVERPGYPAHLWSVVSRPTGANKVVFVNVSSEDGGLRGLPTIARNDHPWLRRDSFIRTDFAMLAAVSAITAGVEQRVLIEKAPLTAATLAKIRAALMASEHTKREIKSVLEEDGEPPSLQKVSRPRGR